MCDERDVELVEAFIERYAPHALQRRTITNLIEIDDVSRRTTPPWTITTLQRAAGRAPGDAFPYEQLGSSAKWRQLVRAALRHYVASACADEVIELALVSQPTRNVHFTGYALVWIPQALILDCAVGAETESVEVVLARLLKPPHGPPFRGRPIAVLAPARHLEPMKHPVRQIRGARVEYVLSAETRDASPRPQEHQARTADPGLGRTIGTVLRAAGTDVVLVRDEHQPDILESVARTDGGDGVVLARPLNTDAELSRKLRIERTRMLCATLAALPPASTLVAGSGIAELLPRQSGTVLESFMLIRALRRAAKEESESRWPTSA